MNNDGTIVCDRMKTIKSYLYIKWPCGMILGLLGRIEFGFSIQIVRFLYFHAADAFLYVVGPSDPVVLSFLARVFVLRVLPLPNDFFRSMCTPL